MRTIKIGALINKSVERATLTLFKPFSLKKWFCLLFIAFMAGALGGGNFNFNSRDFKSKKPVQEEAAVSESAEASEESSSEVLGGATEEGVAVCPLPQEVDSQAMLMGLGVAVVIVTIIFLPLFILFMWLGARFQFIWFEAIVKDDASIKEPFGSYREQGNSLFKLSLSLFALSTIILVALGAWVYLSASGQGAFDEGFEWSFLRIVQMFAAPVLIFILTSIIFSIFYTYIRSFVIPIMAQERCRFIPAWHRFCAIAQDNRKDMILYLFVIMGLGIACSLIALTLMGLLLLTVILGSLVIGGILYILFMILLKAQVIFVILCALIGIPLVIALMIALFFLQLPFAVFFRSFSLYFLSSLNCGYTPLALEEA